MPEVYNWQLGRKMLYPYEERHPKWQFTFVFNITWRPSRMAGTRSSTT